MKVIVDVDACVGCMECEGTCPDVFEMTDEDIALVKVDVVPPELEEACREAAENCPTDAILIEED